MLSIRVAHYERSAAADATTIHRRPSRQQCSRMEFVPSGGWRALCSFKDGCDKAQWRSSGAGVVAVSVMRVCACRCADAVPGGPAACLSPRPRLHVPQHVRRLCPARVTLTAAPSVRQQTVDRSHSRVDPPAPRPADNASYQTTR